MIVKYAPSCAVSIFIAGDYDRAVQVCRQHCDELGLCVTITPTLYVYTGGQEAGIVVGLINYPRFPSDLVSIETHALRLGTRLRVELGQESFSVQTPEKTTWVSFRKADQ